MNMRKKYWITSESGKEREKSDSGAARGTDFFFRQ